MLSEYLSCLVQCAKVDVVFVTQTTECFVQLSSQKIILLSSVTSINFEMMMIIANTGNWGTNVIRWIKINGQSLSLL